MKKIIFAVLMFVLMFAFSTKTDATIAVYSSTGWESRSGLCFGLGQACNVTESYGTYLFDCCGLDGCCFYIDDCWLFIYPASQQNGSVNSHEVISPVTKP